MANPPQAGKMAPERPVPALIDTGKSYPKTGLLKNTPSMPPMPWNGPFPSACGGLPEPL